MAMTVKELINELKKYPQDSLVAWRDHDQGENEIAAHVEGVESFDPKKSFDPEYCKNVRVVLIT